MSDAPDDHLEADIEGYWDDNDGQYDDDPNPYHGTYSEE